MPSILLRATPESFSLNWMPMPAVRLPCARRHPDHVSGDRNFFLAVHQRQQHEHFLAEFVRAAAGNENSAAFHERHVGGIQRVLILDRQRKDARTRRHRNGFHRRLGGAGGHGWSGFVVHGNLLLISL